MNVTRKSAALVVAAVLTMAMVTPVAGAQPPSANTTIEKTAYLVLFTPGASKRDVMKFFGEFGQPLRYNDAVGLGTFTSGRTDVLTAGASRPGVQFVSADRTMGAVPGAGTHGGHGGGRSETDRADAQALERAEADRLAAGAGVMARPARPQPGPTPTGSTEPLASLQWDMAAISAYEAQAVTPGTHAVKVGIIDTGIDASHPDIAPNFDAKLSRNFTRDIPEIDGECAPDPDGSCDDPANVDEGGHGTHVAGTIGAAANGLGVAGVAPGVSLVNLRAGQDSGYFFIQPVADALTYAGDHGIDVVNMSFYTDPWLFNCAANPGDSPAEQTEQKLIIEAMQRSLTYARRHGTTLVSALGNERTDMGSPTSDDTSPDFPEDAPRERTIDNSCLNLPAEAAGVISVTSIGPSGAKADYSNYGLEQADISAPGGFSRDYFGTPKFRTPGNLILSTYPEAVAREEGDIDDAGEPTTPYVIKDCRADGVCGYYEYLQGTSMASPHVAGVAGLVVSRFGIGRNDKALPPPLVELVLLRTATDTPCPAPVVFYPGTGPDVSANCDGTADRNGFYGDGVVNARRAVTLT